MVSFVPQNFYPEDDPRHDPYTMEWNFGPEGQTIDLERYELAPGKIELMWGKLFWTDEQRLVMAGLLVENLGVDAVVKLGDPEVWKAAVARI